MSTPAPELAPAEVEPLETALDLGTSMMKDANGGLNGGETGSDAHEVTISEDARSSLIRL